VVVSYFLLIFLAACAIFIIYRGIENLTTPDEEQAVRREKIQFINEILTGLYEAEGNVGAMIIDISEFNLYTRKIDLVKTKIDTLINLSYNDTIRTSQLDTVLILLDQREKNLRNLVLLFGKNAIEELYKKNLLQAIGKEVELPKYQKTETRIIVKQDTVLHHKPAVRKNFFRRVFSSAEKDTTIEVHSSEYTIVDSLVSFFNPADSIHKILTNVQHNIRNEKVQVGQVLFSEMNMLRESNNLITLKMNNILHGIEKEEFDRSIFLLKAREDSISKIIWTIIIIATIAFFAVIFFTSLIWRNISKSRLYRKRLEEANQTTQKLLESREKLMLSITHDIKAPLSSVIGYIELLNNSRLTERQLHYLKNMQNSSEHSLSLINDILDFNRLNSGEIKLKILLFNEKKLFEDIVTGFLPLAQKKELRLCFEHQNEIDSETIAGDPIRIRQIVNNLLSNAIKFTNEGEVNLHVKVLPKDTNLCLLQIEVSDTGVGIAEEDQKRIFQEYARIDSDEQPAQEGFGLGLPIVHKLVEIQKGEITLSSTKGKGSSFVVTLPLPVTLKESDAKTPPLPSPSKILIIDDDPSQLTMISEQLKNKGITATTCLNAGTALEMIEKESFDIIFTDIQMPELNGFELIKHIRNITKAPVIALSARADIHLAQFKEHGFSSFLSKPFTISQLFSVIAESLSTTNSGLEEKPPTTSNEENRFNPLLSFAAGEKESERAILQSFIEESKKNIENLISLKKKKDIRGINLLAHKMLPIFRMMNEKEIVEWLIALEKMKSLKLMEEESFAERIGAIESIVKEGEEILRC
jgi:signal transduction histidine kinase/FixJ family two-component response regulator